LKKSCLLVCSFFLCFCIWICALEAKFLVCDLNHL
jgi:hypothetical protein